MMYIRNTSAMLALAIGLFAGVSAFAQTVPFSANGPTPQSNQNADSFVASPPVTVMSTAAMNFYGLMFPDMPIGFVRSEAPGQYYAFSSAGSFGGVVTNDPLPEGTYKYVGALAELKPAITNGGKPHYALTIGRVQPSPEGSDFDRDYAGGGPTYELLLRQGISHSTFSTPNLGKALLQIYHGEYWYDYPKGLPAYGGSGLAVSFDEGTTFAKVDQILAPSLSRKDFLAINPSGGLWIDASMTEADAGRGGNKVLRTPSSPRDVSFYYFIFSDRSSANQGNYLGLGRVDKVDMSEALAHGKAPVLHKYFNPEGLASTGRGEDGNFTEPGLGGRSTPIIGPETGIYFAQPFLVYNYYLHKYVLSYMVNQDRIVLQTSDDLFHWSFPTVVVDIRQEQDQRLFYPSMVGFDRDPVQTGKEFFVYYLQHTLTTTGRPTAPRLQRVEITIR